MDRNLYLTQNRTPWLESMDNLLAEQDNFSFVTRPHILTNAFPDLDGYIKRNDQESFVHSPIPIGRKLLCKIIRKRNIASGIFSTGYPYYELYIEGTSLTRRTFFLSAIKTVTKKQNSRYYISTNRFESLEHFRQGTIGKVDSNFSGTVFHISSERGAKSEVESNSEDEREKDVDSKESICVVIYAANFLGFRGPRKMTILLQGKSSNSSIDLYEEYKSGSLSKRQSMLIIKNKMPIWNEETQSFVLNFHGRVSQASVKNFQIIHPEQDQDYIVLQFGRVGTDIFTMDVQYPLNLLNAFGIALTSFDEKRLCE
jgi:tubby-related protein 1